MPRFKKGQRVSFKENPSRKGKIDEVQTLKNTYQFYDIVWDDGSFEIIEETDLIEEVQIKTPWDILLSNSLSDYRNFSIVTTIHKVRNTSSNTISTLKSSRTIFKPYQFKPLIKFLKSDIKRIIVADEVGLGKTIEAGHILLELAARNNLQNAVIICTKSLMDKWQNELQDKFNFSFKIYSSSKDLLSDIKLDIESSKRTIKAIINYEKCRNKDIQKIFELNDYNFDLVICDEAHKLRNSETKQHIGVNKVITKSAAVVFLTATPIMMGLKDLYTLLKILDPDRFNTYDVFQNSINQNKPFIRALSDLAKNAPLSQIGYELKKAKIKQEVSIDEVVFFSKEYAVEDLFINDELYKRVQNYLLGGIDSISNRVKIQQDLIELNSLNNIYTRTRKRDVISENEKVTRFPKTISVNLNPKEQKIFDSIIEDYSDTDTLGMIQKKRQISSCIAAYNSSKEELEKGHYDTKIDDSKFLAFKSIIEEVVVKTNRKLIVFAFFTKTLLYLKIKLEELGIKSEIIYGDIKNRTERIENFQNDNKVQILLSSEVGSEGLDLQFCDAMVNYDLPWNPMVVEQRIGRIDRVGQKSKKISIYNLIISNTIEEKILNRLYDRINLFKESIGDLEEILGENENYNELIRSGIEKLYSTRLTDEEQNLIFAEIQRAFENERQTLEKIKIELNEAFANDLHFQNEINEIEQNQKYLTNNEIVKYIESILRIEMSSIHLEHINENLSKLLIPSNSSTLIFDFIEKYKDSSNINPELDNLYRKFKSKYYGESYIEITFNQNFAFNNKSAEYISAFHPFVNAITNYFCLQGFDKNQSFKLLISKKNLNKKYKIKTGYYVQAVYKIIVKKTLIDGKDSNIFYLKSTIADLNADNVLLLDNDVSEYLNGILHQFGELMNEDLELDDIAVKEIRNMISMKVLSEQNLIRDDEKIKFSSSVRRRAEQEITYLEKRILRVEKNLNENRGIEPILKKEIFNLKEKINQIQLAQQKTSIEVNHSIISINLIQIA